MKKIKENLKSQGFLSWIALVISIFALLKKIKLVDKQLSSGKMTINEARKAVGLLPVNNPDYNVYLMSERFCNSEEKAATCIVAHIKAFRDQAAEEKVADYGEPCKICPCAKNCEHEWLSIMLPLLKKSKLKINMDF